MQKFQTNPAVLVMVQAVVMQLLVVQTTGGAESPTAPSFSAADFKSIIYCRYLLRFGMTGPEHGTHPSPTNEATTGFLGRCLSWKMRSFPSLRLEGTHVS